MKFIKVTSKIKLEYPYYNVSVYEYGGSLVHEKDFQNKQEAKKYFDLLKKKYKNKNDVELYEQKSKDSFNIIETYNSTEDVRKDDGGYKQGYKDGKYMFKHHYPEDPDDIHEKHSEEYERGYWDGVNDEKEKQFYKNSSEQPTTPKPTTTLPDNMEYAWDPKANQWIAVMKDNPVVTPPTYNPNNVNNLNSTTTTQMYTPIKSTLIDSLNQFLDGDKYSKEIKIEKGLISGGLIKLAGINPIRGPKYSITYKGLNLLKQAAQQEYNKEKKSYLIDWYTKDISTVDTTAKTIKSEESTNERLEKSWNKYYPLFIEDLNNYTITEENYSDEDPIAIQLKSVLKALFDSENDKNSNIDTYLYTTQLFKDMIIENTKKGQSVLLESQMPKFSIFEKDGSELAQIEAKNSTDAKVKFIMEHPEYEGSQSIEVKEIDSAYGETTIQGLDFPNQSVSPSTDIKVDTKGWVNVQSAKLTPQLLSLGGILDPYIKNGSVGVSIEDENKGNISVRGDAKTINTIESKVRDLGIFCNNETLPADEGKGIYTLNIFLGD